VTAATGGAAARRTRPNRLPGSDELFRRTADGVADVEVPEDTPGKGPEKGPERGPGKAPGRVADTAPRLHAAPASAEQVAEQAGERQESDRRRHDEKITVYLTGDELFDLEQARLVLKRDFGVRADRGRIVRAALAEALTGLDGSGAESALVRRLTGA
jgi:hypothetical protein